ncbi:response regulator [Altericista sp. CCNU0014]|uniref:hybrid sensor histidine kinase/response regulator n=1 Tax=Altericista sp. CCNU0014 TaxID=3082949 RepID=UPI00384B3868
MGSSALTDAATMLNKTKDSEQQVRLQFLDEAQVYLDEIESGVLGMSARGLDRSTMDGILRAAHSIKGGSAMMGFATLSRLAHRIEDSFKVLKVRPADAKDENVEQLLLLGVDHLRQVAQCDRQGTPLSDAWLDGTAAPTFEALYDRLGEPQPEDETALLSEEAGEDMIALLFGTEVDSILNRLDEVLGNPDLPCLKSEFAIAAQELGGLGEMLDLPTFCDLCQDVSRHLAAVATDRLVPVANQALQAWRKAQAMVTIGQRDLIPTTLGLGAAPAAPAAPSEAIADSSPALSEMEMDWDALGLEELETPADEFEFSAAFESPGTSDPIPEVDDFLELTEVVEALESSEVQPTLEIEGLLTVPEPHSAPPEPTSDLPEIAEPVLAAAEPTPVARSAKTKVGAIGDRADLHPDRQDSEADQTLRVSAQQLNQMGELLGELLIERSGLTLQLKRLRDLTGLLTQRVRSLEESNVQLRSTSEKVAMQASDFARSSDLDRRSARSSAQTEQPSLQSATDGMGFSLISGGAFSDLTQGFDILEMDRYSELHSLSQELMESAVQIEEVTTDINTHLDDAEQTARSLSRTAKKLQVGMTQMRMRPISDVLGRFPRTLRELCQQHNKAVELKISGGSTLVDRTVLETLSDPLIHLFRNSFDHGIETPEARMAKGKPAKGSIAINTAYRGNQIVITLRDDGNGIDLEKVKAKAARMGLDRDTLETATPSELLDLIFEPGFSTAEQVSDLSGRGVGMDIVRTNLQKIKGSISVDTQLGQGTTFTLTVPFNLSVIRVLLVESNGSLMAFPTDSVEEMLLLESQNLSSASGRKTLDLDGTAIPFVQLQDWLTFPRSNLQADLESSPKIDRPSVLLVDRDGEVVGIQVDRYWGEQEVTVRQVEGAIALPSAFAGCTVLGDGRIVPLVDPFSLLQYIDAQSQHLEAEPDAELQEIAAIAQQPIAAIAAAAAPVRPLVMVVDDSVNVRRFLALTLEKAGFRVEQAKDGQHALEQVHSGLPIQAVVCDVEMPRLDGFGFLAHIKAMPTAQNIPVVMLTSRSGDKHRKLAMSLGASDYFSKPFREDTLLETLHQLVAVAA